MNVALSLSELQLCAYVGANRRVMAVKLKRSEPYGTPLSPGLWDNDVESCCAEFAVAKATGLLWHFELASKTKDVVADVGWDVQVRWTRRDDGSLIVYKRDRPDQVYVLVIGQAPNFRVVGWLPGAEAQNEAWWGRKTKDNYAYWVPQGALRSPESLCERYAAPEAIAS